MQNYSKDACDRRRRRRRRRRGLAGHRGGGGGGGLELSRSRGVVASWCRGVVAQQDASEQTALECNAKQPTKMPALIKQPAMHLKLERISCLA